MTQKRPICSSCRNEFIPDYDYHMVGKLAMPVIKYSCSPQEKCRKCNGKARWATYEFNGSGFYDEGMVWGVES